MAHKKKGGSKKPSAPSAPQANGTSGHQEDVAAPTTFKEAILKDAVVDGTGPVAPVSTINGHSEPIKGNNGAADEGSSTSEAPETVASEASALAPEAGAVEDASGPPAVEHAPKPIDEAPHAGTQALHDSLMAREQTVKGLREDLRAEQSRRESAEASLLVWKVTSLSLGASTLALAAIALLTARHCSR